MRSGKKIARITKIMTLSRKPLRIGRRAALWSCKARRCRTAVGPSYIAGAAMSQSFSEMEGAAMGELRNLLAAAETV